MEDKETKMEDSSPKTSKLAQKGEEELDKKEAEPVELESTETTSDEEADDGTISPSMSARDITSTHSGEGQGRTMGGVTFQVPVTYDFLENLQKFKLNFFDYVTLGIIGLQIVCFLFRLYPWWLSFFIFAFWRMSYNVFLGYVLNKQSHSQMVTNFLKEHLTDPKSPFYSFFRKELVSKMGSDYDYDKVPVEYNSWLVFRGFVDIILMNDFFAYLIFVFSFTEIPSEFGFLEIICYIVGFALCVLNWFVKIDALRVIKDFAWYWGDFFFLVDTELTFDGVFQLAPHPMYSIGYMGFYGLTLISRSYAVLYVSLAAHLSQFLFLSLVENPHIHKIYHTMVEVPAEVKKQRAVLYEGHSAYFRRDLIVFKNIDLFRSADLFTVIILSYAVLIYFMGLPIWYYVLQCVVWRILHSFGLGLLLKKQSETQFFTKHYIKYGYNKQDSFNNWKSLYNLSLTMTHITFLICALNLYTVPEISFSSIFGGTYLLKQTIGVLLIALHIWTSVEVYEVIGDFGWFFGDFFLPGLPKHPEYTGIYRYLNNPEIFMGHAAYYGLALMSDNVVMYSLAIASQICTFLFIHHVETPHMKRLYGEYVRKESGVSQVIREKIKPISDVKELKKIKKRVDSLTTIAREISQTQLQEVKEQIDKGLGKAKPKIKDIALNIRHSTESLVCVSIDDNYHLKAPPVIGIGQPLVILWRSPKDHSLKDWVGIYLKSFIPGEISISSSLGRWLYIPEGEEGTLTFEGGRIPWIPGQYEARYHTNDSHQIVCRVPFEIILPPELEKFRNSMEVSVEEIEYELGKAWESLFGSKDTIVADLNDADSKRLKSALVDYIESVFNVELSPVVLTTFPNVALLSQHISEAISLRAPMSSSLLAASSEDNIESYNGKLKTN